VRSSVAKPLAVFALLSVVLFLSGCAAMGAGRLAFAVEVSSLAAPGASARQTYVVLPGNEGIEAGDLLFREFATQVSRVLDSRGFFPADDADKADLAVVLFYGIGDPKVTQYTYALPVWGQTGISSAYTSGVVRSMGNTTTYSGSTTYNPSYGVTGYTTHVGSVTTYFRYADIIGYDLKRFRDTNQQIQLWKTSITSTGSSGDIRRIFPIMIGAATPYLAKDTGMSLEFTLYEDENRVKFVKGLPQE
jgi:hypothetical protein